MQYTPSDGDQAMNTQTHNQIVSQLPEMSAKVYNWLNETGLYAEPTFSDVTVADIAKAVNITVDQAKGCVGHLVNVELCWTEEWETVQSHTLTGKLKLNQEQFIHTYLHNEEIED